MKKLIIFSVIFLAVTTLHAQKKFNEKTGQEILKLFPAKMKDKNAKKEKDKVKDVKGFLGVIVHRDYGDYKQNVVVEAINNSPSLISVNAFLDNPPNKPDQYKVIAIDGFKALVQTIIGENSSINYEVLIPLTATLLKVRSTGYTRDDLIALANTIPVAKIAKMVGR